MPTVRINALPNANPPVDTDYFALDRVAGTGHVTLAQIKTSMGFSAAPALTMGAGSAALPSFSPRATNGLYSSAVDTVDISTASTQRLSISTTALTSTLPIVHPLGAQGAPSLTFVGRTTDGIYSNAAGSLAITNSGTASLVFVSTGIEFLATGQKLFTNVNNGIAVLGGAYTTAANGPWQVLNSAQFTASTAVQQMAFRIYSGVNQTSTASFASLYINQSLSADGVTGTPVFGSGGGLFADFQSGLVSKFQVTNAGAVAVAAGIAPMTDNAIDCGTALLRWANVRGVNFLSAGQFVGSSGSVGAPAFTTTADLNTGFYHTGTGTWRYSGAGTALFELAPAGGLPVLKFIGAPGQLKYTPSTTTTWGLLITHDGSHSGGAVASIGVGINPTVAMTSTGAFTAFDIAVTETSVGSGAQYIINAKAGASGTTQVWAVTNAGTMLFPFGSAGAPSIAIMGEATNGFYRVGSGIIGVATGGALRLYFQSTGLWAAGASGAFNQGTSDFGVSLNGLIAGNVTTPATSITNSANVYVGSSVSQIGTKIVYGVNQTSTATFTALRMDLGLVVAGTSAPVFGSGGGFFLDCAANSVSTFKVTSAGQVLVATGAGATAPSYSFVSFATTGFYPNSATDVRLSLNSNLTYSFTASGINLDQSGLVIRPTAANSVAQMGGNHTTSANGPWSFTNLNAYTASTAVTQKGVALIFGVNQTSTAGFVALPIDLGLVIAGTGVPVFGSAGGFFADWRTNSVSVLQVTAAGAVLGTGTQSLPTFASIAAPLAGMYNSTTTVDFTIAATHSWTMKASSILEGHGNTGLEPSITCGVINSGAVRLMGWVSTATNATQRMVNQIAFSGTGAQLGTEFAYGVNQTGAGQFTAHRINVGLVIAGTGTPVFGTAGGWLADYFCNDARKFSVRDNGGIGVVAVSPGALAAGNTDDYAGIGTYGVARLTGDGAGTSTIRGIVAPLDARMLTIVNISAFNITFNNQDGGSAAANRIQTSTGAAVVLGQNDTMTLWYDLTSAYWRQVTTAA